MGRIMNIFYLHPNPRKCARWACDKHVVKMLLETCQLLYTCHLVLGSDLGTAPCRKGSTERGYKKHSPNHPCGKWVRASLQHYEWLAQYGLELLREYGFRYKGKTHACGEHIRWLCAHPPLGLADAGWGDPACAMPDQYKTGNPVTSYRKYYMGEKTHILTYTGRHLPHWLAARTRTV